MTTECSKHHCVLDSHLNSSDLLLLSRWNVFSYASSKRNPDSQLHLCWVVIFAQTKESKWHTDVFMYSYVVVTLCLNYSSIVHLWNFNEDWASQWSNFRITVTVCRFLSFWSSTSYFTTNTFFFVTGTHIMEGLEYWLGRSAQYLNNGYWLTQYSSVEAHYLGFCFGIGNWGFKSKLHQTAHHLRKAFSI